MATYAYIREQVVQGVIRSASQARNPAVPPPLDRIRAQFDAAFFSINSSVANVFAAKQDNREMLRVSNSITFVLGDGTLPANVLEKFIPDATFMVAATPTKKYAFRRYPQWLRTGDPRLGFWTVIGETVKVKTPAPVVGFSGTGTFTAICSPAVPSTEDDDFDAPEDFISDFIDAMVQYIIGQNAELAAQTA